MQIITKQITYTFASGRTLFRGLDFSLPKGEKAALTGDNGSGKSTFLHILAGIVQPSSGSLQIRESSRRWFIPQHYGQYDNHTIAGVLLLEEKINALEQIERGSADPRHFDTLAGDWAVRERIEAALHAWNLPRLSPSTPLGMLSGGEKTRVFLAGLDLHKPDLVLMDEPTNHLDRPARNRLYRFVRSTSADLLIVSHDRELLNLCNPVYELSPLGVKRYGGNYDFYETQKQIETEALGQRIHHAKKAISGARRKQHETMERKQRRDARGGKKAASENMPRILQNAARNRAEGSTSRLNEAHEQKITEEKQRLADLQRRQRELKNIRLTINPTPVHTGKVLFEAERVNFAWPDADALWTSPLSFTIRSGERLRISGPNGSGKTTLIRILNGDLTPSAGKLNVQSNIRFLLSQEYGGIHREATVLEQANTAKKPAHELRTLLHHYLFEEKTWQQPCVSLSGGEMMRLNLCCLALQSEQPDTLILDEPTNNLDLRNIKLLTDAVASWQGTLIVVSHDRHFVEEVGAARDLQLE